MMIDLLAFELRALAELAGPVAMRICSLLAAYLVAHYSGRFGVTIDQAKLTAALFAAFELARGRVGLYLRSRFPGSKLLPLYIVGLLFCAGQSQAASLAVDRSLDLSPVALRDYTDGIWETGMEKPVLKFASKKGVILDLDAYAVTDMSRANPSAGLSLSVPMGDLGSILSQLFLLGAPTLTERARSIAPNWLAKASRFVSLDIGGGYDFVRSASYIKPWAASIGGRVTIPFGKGSL